MGIVSRWLRRFNFGALQQQARGDSSEDQGVRNRKGRGAGYGGCKRCHDTWDWKPEHITNYCPHTSGSHKAGCSGCRGLFPLCEECWSSLTPDGRLPYYTRLLDLWESQEPPDVVVDRDTRRERVRAAVLDGK